MIGFNPGAAWGGLDYSGVRVSGKQATAVTRSGAYLKSLLSFFQPALNFAFFLRANDEIEKYLVEEERTEPTAGLKRLFAVVAAGSSDTLDYDFTGYVRDWVQFKFRKDPEVDHYVATLSAIRAFNKLKHFHDTTPDHLEMLKCVRQGLIVERLKEHPQLLSDDLPSSESIAQCFAELNEKANDNEVFYAQIAQCFRELGHELS